MTEIIFLFEDDPEGGYVARAVGKSIFTQADSIHELRELVRDAVSCHYPDEVTRPKLIRLHIVLSAILKDVEKHFDISREQLLDQLFY